MAAQRPEWLRKYVLVEGTLSSAPLDLPKRFERVLKHLQTAGWRVAVKSIGTDFGSFIPTPQDQPLAVYLYRIGAPFTAADAGHALAAALRSVNMGYSGLRAWAAEVVDEVIVPTARGAVKTSSRLGQLAALGAGAALVMALLRK